MEIGQEDIAEILAHLKSSEFTYLRIAVGKVTLVASKTPLANVPHAVPDATTPQVVPAGTLAGDVFNRAELGAPSTEPAAATSAASPQTDSGDPDLIAVTAPMIGTFYAAPKPEAEPFVAVGEEVKKGQSLGLIEAMKMFNTVEASVDGIVEARLVENGGFVEFGQNLFLIRPKNEA